MRVRLMMLSIVTLFIFSTWKIDQRWRTIISSVVIITGAVLFSSCYQDSTSPLPIPLPPTWTPTILPGVNTAMLEKTPVLTISPRSTTAPLSSKEASPQAGQQLKSSTPKESTQETEADATRIPPVSPVPQTPSTSSLTSKDGRIDSVGPVTVATVEPLSVGSGMPPVRLLIPALGLDTPVQTMSWKVIQDAKGVRSEWDVVDFAAGHHINSAFPGEPGNVVLSGHNNISGAVFQSVCVIGEPGVDFGLGDEMILEDKRGRRFIYQVNGWRRIEEANASISQRQENAQYLNPTTFAQLTLVTCWPPTSNTHRVVVTGLLSGME